MHVLASQLHFLANRNAELAIPPFFRPINCLKIGGHVALLCDPILFIPYTVTYTTNTRIQTTYKFVGENNTTKTFVYYVIGTHLISKKYCLTIETIEICPGLKYFIRDVF